MPVLAKNRKKLKYGNSGASLTEKQNESRWRNKSKYEKINNSRHSR